MLKGRLERAQRMAINARCLAGRYFDTVPVIVCCAPTLVPASVTPRRLRHKYYYLALEVCRALA